MFGELLIPTARDSPAPRHRAARNPLLARRSFRFPRISLPRSPRARARARIQPPPPASGSARAGSFFGTAAYFFPLAPHDMCSSHPPPLLYPSSLRPPPQGAFCVADEQAKDRSYIRVIVERNFLPAARGIDHATLGDYPRWPRGGGKLLTGRIEAYFNSLLSRDVEIFVATPARSIIASAIMR